MIPLNNLFSVLGSLCAFVFTYGGAKIGTIIADTSSTIPDWSRYLLGPLGALVGMIFAVRWLAIRLDKVEQQAREDQEERQHAILAMIKEHAALSERCVSAIESNTEALERLGRE